MKKLGLIIIVLASLLMTGCFSKPEDILKKANNKMSELNNYYTDVKMEMIMEKDGSSMSFGYSGFEKADNKNKTTYGELTISFFGISTTSKIYSIIKDNQTYSYTEEEKVWHVEQKEVINNLKLSEAKEVTLVSKEKGEIVLNVKFSDEIIKNVLYSTSNNIENKTVNIDYNNVKVTVTINNDNYVSKLSVSIPAEYEGTKVTMNQTIEYSKYNEVGNITIPDYVIDNAIDKKTEELKENAQDYMNEAEYEVWGDEELENKVFTDTNLEYDGVKPTKVELTMVDGVVKEGIIELDGYRATFKDSEIVSFEKIK